MNLLIETTTDLGAWLSAELSAVSSVISDHLRSEHESVNGVCEELAAYKGKMLRPSLLLLSWRATSGAEDVPERVRVASAVVELIHFATLVHDDVLDGADLRRGKQTINMLCGNEAAVMLGDYLLSSAFHLCSTLRIPRLNILLGEVTRTVCAGEMMQLCHRNDVELDVDSYYQIIRDKTASLIAASCEMGAVLGGGSSREILLLQSFGGSIGVAFQIRDDLLDLLGDRQLLGKPAGIDLEKGKLTLPVLLMLNKSPELRPKVRDAISNNNLYQLRSMLVSAGSFEDATEVVGRLVDEAVKSIRDNMVTVASEHLCHLAEQLNDPI